MVCATCGKAIDENYGATPEQAKYIHISEDAEDVDHEAVLQEEVIVSDKAIQRTRELLAAGCKLTSGQWYQDGVFLADNARDALEALRG